MRLTADDTEYEASADVTISVNPEVTQTNQPPVVNPGPNQTIPLPTDTVTSNGSATDDGLLTSRKKAGKGLDSEMRVVVISLLSGRATK